MQAWGRRSGWWSASHASEVLQLALGLNLAIIPSLHHHLPPLAPPLAHFHHHPWPCAPIGTTQAPPCYSQTLKTGHQSSLTHPLLAQKPYW